MTTCRIGSICLSAHQCDAMAAFYAAVFGIAFASEEVESLTVYSGSISGIEFTLVPAQLTQVTTTENKVHLDLYVDDIDRVVDLVGRNGGRTNGKLVADDQVRCIGVFDPDGNFMAVKQRLRSTAAG